MKDQSVVRAESRSRYKNAANTDKFSTAPETEYGNLDGQVSLRRGQANANDVKQSSSDGSQGTGWPRPAGPRHDGGRGMNGGYFYCRCMLSTGGQDQRLPRNNKG